MHESVVGHISHVGHVVEGAAVIQHVEIDDGVVRMLLDEVSDDVATDETGAAAKQYDSGYIRVGRATDGRIRKS